MKPWLLAIRPKTLTIAVVPVLVGSVVGWRDIGTLIWPVMLAAVMAALLIQIGTNLHNDAADFERGADRSATRLGPPRATAEGWLSPVKVKAAAVLSFVLATLIGLYLVWWGGWPILLIGLVSIAAGWAYTGGPKPIAYLALGELFVFVFFGLVAVLGSYYLQTGQVSGSAWIAGAMIGMPAAAVLVVNNYRDLDNDRHAGKRTFAVRFGRRASRVEYGVLMLLPFALLPLLYSTALGARWLVLPLFVIPWALQLLRRFATEPLGPGLNEVLVSTARFQLGFGVLLCVALLGSGIE